MNTVVTLTVNMHFEHSRGDKSDVEKEARRFVHHHLDHWVRVGADRGRDIGPYCIDLLMVSGHTEG